MKTLSPYVVYNFDKISEPEIWKDTETNKACVRRFEFQGQSYKIAYPNISASESWICCKSVQKQRVTKAAHRRKG